MAIGVGRGGGFSSMSRGLPLTHLLCKPYMGHGNCLSQTRIPLDPPTSLMLFSFAPGDQRCPLLTNFGLTCFSVIICAVWGRCKYWRVLYFQRSRLPLFLPFYFCHWVLFGASSLSSFRPSMHHNILCSPKEKLNGIVSVMTSRDGHMRGGTFFYLFFSWLHQTKCFGWYTGATKLMMWNWDCTFLYCCFKWPQCFHYHLQGLPASLSGALKADSGASGPFEQYSIVPSVGKPCSFPHSYILKTDGGYPASLLSIPQVQWSGLNRRQCKTKMSATIIMIPEYWTLTLKTCMALDANKYLSKLF